MQYISKSCGKSYILGSRNQMSLRYFYEPSKQMIACDDARGENSDESQPDNCAVGTRHSLGGEGPIYSQLWMCLDICCKKTIVFKTKCWSDGVFLTPICCKALVTWLADGILCQWDKSSHAPWHKAVGSCGVLQSSVCTQMRASAPMYHDIRPSKPNIV